MFEPEHKFKLDDQVVVVNRLNPLSHEYGTVCAVRCPPLDYYIEFDDGSRDWVDYWHLRPFTPASSDSV